MSVKRTCPTPNNGLTHLLNGRGRSVVCTVFVWSRLTAPRGVIDPLYHSGHNNRDRQYEYDRGISCVIDLSMFHQYRKRYQQHSLVCPRGPKMYLARPLFTTSGASKSIRPDHLSDASRGVRNPMKMSDIGLYRISVF